MHSFRLTAVDPAAFTPLFELSDAALRDIGAQRCIAAASPGYPCRVSLQDAAVGDELLLLPYVHQPAASPYRASGPIFVRRGAVQRRADSGELPACLATRLLSLRGYDSADAIVDAVVCDGAVAAAAIDAMFGAPGVAYIHVHYAKYGCYACRVDRV